MRVVMHFIIIQASQNYSKGLVLEVYTTLLLRAFETFLVLSFAYLHQDSLEPQVDWGWVFIYFKIQERAGYAMFPKLAYTQYTTFKDK